MTSVAINELKKYALGKKNTEKVEISVLQLNRVIKALEQSSYNSIKTELKPCEDAISRRAVIDGINRYFHDEYYQRTSIQDCRDCLIEDVINKLPAVNPQPKWIPVSEKLPEEGKEVLTCSNGGFIEIQSLEDSSADIYWENQKGDWTDIDEVIAWMPLPKPYESQKSNDKCKNCEYYRNPDYTRCHECKAESEEKEK